MEFQCELSGNRSLAECGRKSSLHEGLITKSAPVQTEELVRLLVITKIFRLVTISLTFGLILCLNPLKKEVTFRS